MNVTKTAERLRTLALSLPEAYEETPWGERVVKVKGKIFLFVGVRDGLLHMSVKLPESGTGVLREKLGEPTGYGLGKSGWVTVKLAAAATVKDARVDGWVKESYRAIAPKKLSLALDQQPNKMAVQRSLSIKPDLPKKIVKLKTRIFLLCQDPLRAERATEALAARGATCRTIVRADAMRAMLDQADAVIIDVGRLAAEGLALAAEIEESDHPILLFIVGVRDGAAQKRAEQSASSADLHRAPAGDPAVADAIIATLQRYAKKS
jgi:predicted DNA-binding protein (MmcQ/YjbR family)